MIRLMGGPQDGREVTEDTTGIMVLAVEIIDWDGVQLASYRINPDRTEATYTGTRRVWPRDEDEP